jgi:Fe-S cluster biogenesis protein NfuA
VESKQAFQEMLRRLGVLIGELDTAESSRARARELIQLLIDVHGAALERMMEIIFESGAPGEKIMQRAGQDSIVRHLLLLHSLHPEDLETRVLRALDTARPQLRKQNAEVELVDMREGVVQARIRISGHACGSTERTLKALLEEIVYDHAPDLTSLEILGPGDEAASGFVSIESLLKQVLPAHEPAADGVKLCGAD